MMKNVSMKELKASFEGLRNEVKTEIGDVRQDLGRIEKSMNTNFSDLQSSVDRYLKFTQTWHQEFTILRARHNRLENALTTKGIVSEKDIRL